jgi:anti-sigma factor RsiW
LDRPLDKHIDNEELNALVPSTLETVGAKGKGLSPEALRAAERHVAWCWDCGRKVAKYRQLVMRLPEAMILEEPPQEVTCPTGEDVDWDDVAAGLWPEWKARELISHAALCDRCGPLLRAATVMPLEPTPEEERLLAKLTTPSRPVPETKPALIRSHFSHISVWRRLLQWEMLVPALALLVIVTVLGTRQLSMQGPVSGAQFAEFAVNTHRQHAQGNLSLDIRTDSHQKLNQWLKGELRFPLALPESAAIPGEERPNGLEGARLVGIGGKTAAFIAYQMPTPQMPKAAVSILVAPNSVAVASGGVEVDFKKVSFHYATVEGYKVVTWSLHGLTYALVSQEGNRTQRSCMVCHSAMRDRDLSQTPTPLHTENNLAEPVWQ